MADGSSGMKLTRRGLMATVWATGLVACSPGPKSAATAPASAPAFDPGPDATGLAALIAKGSMSPAEAVDAAIKRAQAAQPQINFMVADTFDAARARAATTLTGPFAGVPTLIKDLNDVIGVPTRFGSRATEGAAPATEESVYVSTLLGSGLICIGKSATPENGYLPTTEPSGVRTDAQSMGSHALDRWIIRRDGLGSGRRRYTDGARK